MLPDIGYSQNRNFGIPCRATNLKTLLLLRIMNCFVITLWVLRKFVLDILDRCLTYGTFIRFDKKRFEGYYLCTVVIEMTYYGSEGRQ